MTFIKTPFAVSGTQSVIPEDAQPDDSISFEEGYPLPYEEDPGDPGVLYPDRGTFNYLMFLITSEIQRWQTQAYPDFITSSDNGGTPYIYSKNAYVRFDDGVLGDEIYWSLVDGNNSDPTDTTKWARVQGSGVPTGTGIDYWGATLPTGWTWANGNTIGATGSGATALTGSAALNLYTLLWDSTSNTVLPIQTSAGAPTTRGASAAADWMALKRMPLPDKRDRVSVGKGDMGGTSAINRITNAIAGFVTTTLAAFGGDQNLSAHDHAVGTLAGSVDPHSHFTVANNSNETSFLTANVTSTLSMAKEANTGGGPIPSDSYYQLAGAKTGDAPIPLVPSLSPTSESSPDVTLSGETDIAGTGASANVQPTIVCNYIIKL